MIDIYDELLFEIDSRTINVRTLNHENAIVFAIDGRRDANQISAGKLLISMRRRVAHDDLDVLVERAQQPIESKG